MKKLNVIFIIFLTGCYNENEILIDMPDLHIAEVEEIEGLEYAISLEKVPVNEAYRDAQGKTIEELLSNLNYMAYIYGGLDVVNNESELESLLLKRLETFDVNIGIYYKGEDAPMIKLESMYKEWLNTHDQISATVLGYGYFVERVSEGYFIHLENNFTMNRHELDMVNKRMDEMVAELNLDGMGDIDKVETLYQFVMERMEYVGNGQNTQHSPMGFIFHGEGVCQAYAISLHMLLERIGLESRYIIGEIHKDQVLEGEPIGHAWNMVKLDGNWYHLDPTWDDGGERWLYFLVSDGIMEFSRTWEKRYYESAPNSFE